ncbi:hypothetical protein DFH09DRAFT_1246149 [Mycena vulgaris]|nr:hypothetical protein DFH09DRAFT_1246149 [Mycena vulgaris]
MDSSALPPSSVLFARGVIARLVTWDTLRLAVQEGWAFEETVPTPDDQHVEEILVQVLADEFDTDLEDGSAEPVALDIVRLWDATCIGRDELVLKFEAKADFVREKRAVAQEVANNNVEEWEDEDDEADDSGMDDQEDEEAPQLTEPRRNEEPAVDEDRFNMVKAKGKSHR